MTYIANLKTFVRAYELGSMSAAGRDLRVSGAVASNRIGELEKHLGVRLFHRTTRSLKATEQGALFYTGATRILDEIITAETQVSEITNTPRGTIFVAAPLGLGKKTIAPSIPQLQQQFPELKIRLRLSDRKIDVAAEGLDIALVLGTLNDSQLRVRHIHEFERVLCASPEYLKAFGRPNTGHELVEQNHNCLLLRFPGAHEFYWSLMVDGKARKFNVTGALESDDGDVLTQWALTGNGIINKPRHEISHHLNSGALEEVVKATPPSPIALSCVYPHKRLQDRKARIFIDHIVKLFASFRD